MKIVKVLVLLNNTSGVIGSSEPIIQALDRWQQDSFLVAWASFLQ